ncbi:hypothetical protein WMY93_008887 [Mugilogobius chulae]|uniref:Gypsy retrotransposon integrase-like protein 1 n=1 Tax=Mugilogobius chulae TaxID=88201 RepID=A0AAW0PDU7_9GOBI
MSLLGQSVTELCPSSAQVKPPPDEGDGGSFQSTGEGSVAPNSLQSDAPVPPATTDGQNLYSNPAGQNQDRPRSRASFLSASAPEFNPPQVQRYLVEHIVKNDELSMHLSSHRLRAFSGRLPRPQHESDYDAWRSGVDLLMGDPSVSDLQRSRKIFESLFPPAADMVKHLRADTPPVTYLQILDSAYGTVQDGDELYAKFMDSFQDAGEKPSIYLQRLQVALTLAVKRGGVPESAMDRFLLNQFCRGCWNNTLISELQLKQRKSNPPTFSDFLLLLRTEEDREAAKALRMKQHLGSVKPRAATQAQYAYTAAEEKSACDDFTTVTQQLAKQLADIQKQLASLTAAQASSRSSASFKSTHKSAETQKGGKSIARPPNKNPSSGPRPGYCFQCGEDGHIKSNCDNDPNPSLVAAKKKQFNQKQQKWQKLCPGHITPFYWLGPRRTSGHFFAWGAVCANSLVALPNHPQHKIPVVLSNESEQSIALPPLSVIAELVMSPQILSLHAAPERLPSKDHLHDSINFDFGNSPIPPEWKERVIRTLQTLPEVFAHHDLDFGRTDKVKHRIHLHDETAFKHRARPIHPNDIEAVRNHLRDLLEAGVIRESESPFSSPIVVVRKKNGDVRLCIDYRKLNLQTVKDAYALPNLEESFSALNGSRWFSVLGLKSGYYQIEMEEADKAKTAFVTPLGFWEFNRMPQGVTNAPGTFQRLMEKCMGDLHLKEVLVFLDDLIIFSDSLEEHERRLLRVLHRLKEYGLKLSPDKCRFFQTSVKYLGHVVSERGVETDPEKVSALKSWPTPRTLKELKSFLGFAGYYRKFIRGYSAIAKPLNDLTKGYTPSRRSAQKRSTTTSGLDSRQPFGERWTIQCQHAFDMLIEKLTTAPVLGFANPKLPYILHTDASTTGLGAALYQEQEGQLRVIAYASRGLSTSEARYPAHKLEFLALKWSVTEKFHDFLYGAEFVVITDNNPLTYILTSAKLDAASHRWLASLSTYNFKLQYRAGKQNLDADALSRRPHEHQSDKHLQQEWDLVRQFARDHSTENEVEVSPEVVAAICLSSLTRSSSPDSANCSFTLVESMSVTATAVPECFADETQHGLPVISTLSHLDLKERQRADPCIREIIHQIETGEKIPPTAKQELPNLSLLLRELNRLELRNDVLYRRRQDGEQIMFQLVLPEELRSSVFDALHSDMGHMGMERTLDLIRSRFFWPRMAADVETKVRTCPRCVRRKALPEKAAQLVNIKTTRPLELLCAQRARARGETKEEMQARRPPLNQLCRNAIGQQADVRATTFRPSSLDRRPDDLPWPDNPNSMVENMQQLH